MAQFDHGGGCACGLQKVCDCAQQELSTLASGTDWARGVVNVPAPDLVNHPHHYSRWKMEPIEYIMVNDLPGWHANVVKYIARWDAKDGLNDLYKARSYLDMKIRQLEGHSRFWEKPVAEERKASGNDKS